MEAEEGGAEKPTTMSLTDMAEAGFEQAIYTWTRQESPVGVFIGGRSFMAKRVDGTYGKIDLMTAIICVPHDEISAEQIIDALEKLIRSTGAKTNVHTIRMAKPPKPE